MVRCRRYDGMMKRVPCYCLGVRSPVERCRGYENKMQGVQWRTVDGTMASCRGYIQLCKCAGCNGVKYGCNGAMFQIDAPVSDQRFRFYFARFAAAWVWESCKTVFVGFSSLNIFLLYMRLSFFIMICSLCLFHFDKWLLRNIEPRKVIVLKSGRQQGQEAGVC